MNSAAPALVRQIACATCVAISIGIGAPAFGDDPAPPGDSGSGGSDQGAPGMAPPADSVNDEKEKEKPPRKRRRLDERKPADEHGGAQQQMESAEILGHRDADTEARRDSTATKMVFGREELDRYGDTSIGEVLKRLPGITISGRPGRGGDIRMRGLGHGYTQILLNGEPVPRGFSLDTLAPEQVERIEIMRAPVAEHSARGIAGTINVVLREDYVKRDNEIRLGDTTEQGHSQVGVSALRSDTIGPFGYNVTINAFTKNQGNEIETSTVGNDPVSGRTVLDQQEYDDSRTKGQGVHLTSRMTWHVESADTLTLQPFLMESRSETPGNSTLDQSIGTAAAPYAIANWLSDTNTTIARLFSNWEHKMEGGAKLMVRFGAGTADTDASTYQNDYNALGAPSHTLYNATQILDRSFTNGGKYSRPLGHGQDFSAGWDLESAQRVEGGTTIQDGTLELAQFGEDIRAGTTRLAGFVQDDWNITPRWATYAGLRWEGITTTSSYADTSIRNTSGVWSPMLHSLWRLSESNDDQLRLALTRSYRQPTLNNLVARPTLSALYPVSGPNTATSPDLVGNPELKPELAWGLDAGYEHYLSQGGILAVSAFHRSIDDLMRSSTTLQTVSWSPVPRWVSQPANIGRAQTTGIELEAKFRLQEFINDGPPLDVRANYSRFWSSVQQIVGPDNRLDQQPRETANLGADYRFRALPLTIGGNLNWTPAYLVQQSNSQIYGQGLKEVLDCYALWKFSPATQLRIAADNLLHRDYLTANTVLSNEVNTAANVLTRTYIAWTARLEIKF